MKVKDVISKIVDNYYPVVVEVFDRNTHLIKVKYTIKPHAVDFTNIPEDVWDTEVGMVIPFFDSLVISVLEREVLA